MKKRKKKPTLAAVLRRGWVSGGSEQGDQAVVIIQGGKVKSELRALQ